MADDIRWLTMMAFPGVDLSTADALLQPSSTRTPMTMRSMVGIDPFLERGIPKKAAGYSAHSTVTGTPQALIAWQKAAGSETLYRFAAGVLYSYSAGTWSSVTSSHLPMHTSNRIRWCVGRDALFLVDGSDKPKVIGWNYDAGDTTVTWDTEHVVAEINHTAQSSGQTMNATGCCYHGDRLVIWKDTTIRWSAPTKPTTFYDAGDTYVMEAWKYLSELDGLSITNGISLDNQMLVIGKPYSLHGFVGTDPALNYSHIILDSSRGVLAPDSLCTGDGRAWFCALEGPCVLDTKNGVNFIGSEIQALWETMSFSQKQTVIGWYEDNAYHIVLPIINPTASGSAPAAAATAHLVYDVPTKRWAQMWGILGPHTIARSGSIGQYCLTSTSSKVYRQYNGTSLDGTAFPEEIVTPWMEMGSQQLQKWFRKLRTHVATGATGVVVEYGIDFSDTFVPFDLVSVPSSVTWEDDLDPAVVYWSAPTPSYWVSQGAFDVQIPMSIHARVMRFRIRGTNLGLRSLAIGYEFEGV